MKQNKDAIRYFKKMRMTTPDGERAKEAALEALGHAEKFPNGLTNWIETHHEIVERLALEREKIGLHTEVPAIILETNATQGTGGFYELGEYWTDEFERLHAGREWDGEYFDEIEKFLDEKMKG